MAYDFWDGSCWLRRPVDIRIKITKWLLLTGVYFGIYEEGIYMVKVILTEIRHFECPNQKIYENRLVTKCSNLSKESLRWPNTQIQIHKYTNTQIQFGRKVKIGMTCAIFLKS